MAREVCKACGVRKRQAHLFGLCGTCANGPKYRVGVDKHKPDPVPEEEGAARVLPPVPPSRTVTYRTQEFDVVWDGT